MSSAFVCANLNIFSMSRWLLILWIYQSLANATPSACILEGVPEFSSRTTYQLKTTINDTYRGELAIFRTKNIQRVKIKENRYFNVTWKNQILILATGLNFDKFELENGYTIQPSISVTLHFDCTEDQEKDLIFIQRINDTNNYSPELNQNSFTYVFGMTVPKDFVLTDLIPIKAFDNDISNGQIYFDIPANHFFKIQRKGSPKSYSLKEFSTKLVALKDIRAPFNQQFNLLVTDGDNPSRKNSSTITIIVTTPNIVNTVETGRVFAKHLYHAQYKPKNSLKTQEKILTNGDANIVLKQRGYENYFNISLCNSEMIVNNVKPLPLDVFKLDFIVIEVDAFDKSLLRLRERTAILVQLPEHTGSVYKNVPFDFSAKTLFLITLLLITLVSITLKTTICNFLINCFSKDKSY